MDDTINFFIALTERRTWIRVFDVIVGAVLIYFSLMSGQNRLAGFL